MANEKAWRGFERGRWSNDEVDVRDFIQRNYTPYEGEGDFLAPATEATKTLWAQVMQLSEEERIAIVLDRRTLRDPALMRRLSCIAFAATRLSGADEERIRGLLDDAGVDIERLRTLSVIDIDDGLVTGRIPERISASPVISSDFTITCPGPTPRSIHLYASPESSDTISTWKITKQSMRTAFSLGMTPDDVERELTSLSSFPLPDTIIPRIEGWHSSFSSVKARRALILTADERNARIIEALPTIQMHIIERLGDVRRHRDAVSLARRHTAPQILLRTGIGGMRCQTGADTGRTGAFLQQRRQIAVEGFEPRIEIGAAEQRPHAGLFDGIEDGRFRPVHIDNRCSAAQQHLGGAQQGSRPNIVVGQMRFKGPDAVVEPRHQRHVIGIAAFERHGHVAMGVDESGHQHAAAAIDHPHIRMLLAPALRFGRLGRNQGNATALDADPTRETVRFTSLGGHRQHRTIFK